MNTQALASALLQLLPRVNIPMTQDNLQSATAIYDTLGAMARGELILTTAAAELQKE